MTKENLALSLRRTLVRAALRLTELIVAFDVDLRAPGKALQVIVGVGIEAEDTMPARARVRARPVRVGRRRRVVCGCDRIPANRKVIHHSEASSAILQTYVTYSLLVDVSLVSASLPRRPMSVSLATS